MQRAHLMVNYDLPWNPNRLEQGFGRTHRIGQTEVCHLWNLVAGETREGQVRSYAINSLSPRHLERIKERRETLINKTLQAVQERLTCDRAQCAGRIHPGAGRNRGR